MISLLWIEFIFVSLALLFFGYKASKIGYLLSKITLFSETFIGMIFLAISTSTPELFASIGSAGIVQSSNLASGTVFGTLIINLMVITLIDIVRRESLFFELDKQHIFTGILCIMILNFMVISIILQDLLKPVYMFSHVGLDSIFIFIICIISLRLLFKFEHKRRKNFFSDEGIPSHLKNLDRTKLWIKFSIYILLVAASGIGLAYISDRIVTSSQWWNYTYFGSVFLAISSSLPEIVVSISSSLVGSANMAVGNILGSNLVDMMIIPISDIFFVKGGIFSSISMAHIFTAVTAILLTSLIIIGLIYRSKKSIYRLSLTTIFMIFIFISYYSLLLKVAQ